MKTKRSWDLISDERRKSSIEEIIRFFQNELEQDIGVITGEAFLDMVLENVANDLYNQGVVDSEKVLEERFKDLRVDMNVLIKGV